MTVSAAASQNVDKKYVPGEPIANACVVVTGANRGIGLEFCKQILAKSPGNSVVASCRDPNAADDLAALQKEVGESRLAVVALDVADETSIASWAQGLGALEPVQAHGGSIDVVINNAGTTGTDGYSKWELEDMTADEMMHVYKINTRRSAAGHPAARQARAHRRPRVPQPRFARRKRDVESRQRGR